MSHWILRLLDHRRLDAADAKRLLGPGAGDRIAQRVAASETRHTGEIRVCIESGLPLADIRRGGTARERAVALFGSLGVWDTEHNNGVLIYLLLAERSIEIVADRGLDRHVDAATWERLLATMRGAFAARRFEDGLNAAIDAVDAVLTAHFALAPGAGNANELPDAPVFG